ncbi:MAG: YncE family protein [Chitinophagales bacterium]
MTKRNLQFLFLATLSLLTAKLQAQSSEIYVLDKKIKLTGNSGFDYLSIDDVNRRLYISHGVSVNVVDLNTDQQIGEITGMQGVHGIAVANDLNKGFISDGRDDAVVVFDLKTLNKITTVKVSGKGPDAIAYDPFSHRVFSFNGESNNASVVDGSSMKEIGTVDLGGGPEFAVPDGKGKMYNNLEDKNSLNVIDTKALKVINNYPLAPCGRPTGLAMDAANNRLFTVCRENKGMSVVDIATGKVTTTVPIGAGVDAVAYDPVTKFVFCSNGDGTTTIIRQESADSYTVVQTLQTQVRAKTMALDKKTHKIYLSVAEFQQGTRNVIPDTFMVLVYKMK